MQRREPEALAGFHFSAKLGIDRFEIIGPGTRGRMVRAGAEGREDARAPDQPRKTEKEAAIWRPVVESPAPATGFAP